MRLDGAQGPVSSSFLRVSAAVYVPIAQRQAPDVPTDTSVILDLPSQVWLKGSRKVQQCGLWRQVAPAHDQPRCSPSFCPC